MLPLCSKKLIVGCELEKYHTCNVGCDILSLYIASSVQLVHPISS